ncbi:HlyD family efflux transporter periplasmic adaptor subunit [Pseudorhodoferax sp.]|uniref:HlyD family efflux transporter periplasmic adaptor subunit n=1 Tax=Pseudorhodoferax sp. TaxID=1993553 RepID=UPI0039E3054E
MKTPSSAPRRHPILWLLAGTVALAVGFAAVFEIDQAVRAQGQIIPGSRTQVIQAVDGGMLTALHVREGDAVKARQKLAELEPDRAEAGVAQSRAEVASKRIALVRARAELAGQAPNYPAREYGDYPDFVAAQQGIYRQRRQSLDEELSTLQQAMQLAADELKMARTLHEGGDISRSEVMRAERQVLDLRSRINATRNKYFQETRSEIAKLEDELSTSRYKLDERQSILKHTDLVSPMDGIVKQVRVTTVGGVLKPGDELMQISPVDDELLVEIKVNPADVGLLKPGLPVTLRFDAFDASIYGSVHGRLRYISPDTLTEQAANGQTQAYYRAQVEIDWPETQRHPANRVQSADLKPGLTATADVLTGRRSILNFLMKPIGRAFSGALTQR